MSGSNEIQWDLIIKTDEVPEVDWSIYYPSIFRNASIEPVYYIEQNIPLLEDTATGES